MSATLLATRKRGHQPLLHRKTHRVPNPQRVPAVVNGDTPTPFPDGVLPPITTAPMPAILPPSFVVASASTDMDNDQLIPGSGIVAPTPGCASACPDTAIVNPGRDCQPAKIMKTNPAGTKLILWAALCMGFSLMHALYKELAAESVAAINADPAFNQLSFADWACLRTPARAGRCNSAITARRTKKS